MKRFAIVCAQEFKEALRSKPFIVISVFLAVMLLLLAGAGVLLTSSMDSADSSADYTGLAGQTDASGFLYTVAVCDKTDTDAVSLLSQQRRLWLFSSVEEADESGIETMLTDGGYDAYIVLRSLTDFDIYEPADIYGASLGEDIREALVKINRMDMMEQLGISPELAQDILADDYVWYTSHAVGGYDMGKYIYNYVMIILMFLVIALYGQMVATRVAAEKSSRTMEVLATSVSPAELLCGKVMGVGLAGLMQMGIFIGCAAAIIKHMLSRSAALSVIAEQILSISGFDIACLVLFFVLGFLVYAFIFGALGSMVSQLEDLSGVVALPTYVFMAGYMISALSSVSSEPGVLMRVASFVPFWSPVTMFARMSMEPVGMAEIIISLLLLVATVALTAWLSARIYRSGMLRYGKPPRLKEIINAARSGKE